MRFVRAGALLAAAALVAGCASAPEMVAGNPAPLAPAPATRTPPPTRTRTPPASTSPPAGPTATRPAPVLPTGYETVELAAHGVIVRMPVPVGWSRTRNGLGYDFRDPGRTLLLRLNVTERTPGESIRESWQSLERQTRLPGYRRLDARDLHGFFDEALDWTFLFDDAGGTKQVIDRLLLSGPAAVAVYFSAPRGDFGRLLPVWNRAKDGLTIS